MGHIRSRKTLSLRASVATDSFEDVGVKCRNLASPSVFSKSPAGLFAPFGLDWTPTPGRIGFFLSVLDFGNYLSSRSSGEHSDGNDGTVEKNTDDSLSNALSPGLYVRVGLGDSPLVAGFGVSYGSELRKGTMETGEQTRFDTKRYSIFIAVDVTLFPLF